MTRIGRPPTPEDVRFFRHVQERGECWEWTGTTNGGYGHFRRGDGTRAYAHRWSFTYFIGDIPEGLQLDHLCRNRACVNPWHVEPVTPRVNTLRGDGLTAALAAQTHCTNGHEFTDGNTIRIPRGRECRTCRVAIHSRYRARKKAAA